MAKDPAVSAVKDFQLTQTNTITCINPHLAIESSFGSLLLVCVGAVAVTAPLANTRNKRVVLVQRHPWHSYDAMPSSSDTSSEALALLRIARLFNGLV